MTIKQIVDHVKKQLKIENGSFEAEEIICFFLKCERIDLILKKDELVDPLLIKKISDAANARQQGEPLAYLLGEKYFFKNKFIVRPGVLIPRSDTELIVEEVLKINAQLKGTILDIGCGSGCIGLSLISELKEFHLLAVDKYPVPIQLTLENARAMALESRTTVVQDDIEEFVKKHSELKNTFDFVVSNPPYIDLNDEFVADDVKKHEPSSALFAQGAGLKDICNWASLSFDLLKPQGYLLIECGWKQSQNIKIHFKNIGYQNIYSVKDIQGIERVIVGQRGT